MKAIHYNLKFDQIRISHRCLTSLMKMSKVDSCIALAYGVWHANKIILHIYNTCKNGMKTTKKRLAFVCALLCFSLLFLFMCVFLVSFVTQSSHSQEHFKIVQFFFISFRNPISIGGVSVCACFFRAATTSFIAETNIELHDMHHQLNSPTFSWYSSQFNEMMPKMHRKAKTLSSSKHHKEICSICKCHHRLLIIW